MTAIRAGDHVHHGPTDEDWVVAYVDGRKLAWCGWPAGEARLDDCTLIKSCTDDEHVSLLKNLSQGRGGGKRASMARRELKRIKRSAA